MSLSNMQTTAAKKGLRLIDLDSNKKMAFKDLVNFCPPGPICDAITAGLRQLGLKVYDATEASNNFERDFPLWNEALILKDTDQAYGRAEFDKLTGPYHALVGLPAALFSAALVKSYDFHTKFLVVGDFKEKTLVQHVRSKIQPYMPALMWYDPKYFGQAADFFDLADTNAITGPVDLTNVPKKSYLHIDDLDWKRVCELIGKPIQSDLPLPIFTKRDTFDALPLRRAKVLFWQFVQTLHLFFIYALMALAIGFAGFNVAKIVHFGHAISIVFSLVFALTAIACLAIMHFDLTATGSNVDRNIKRLAIDITAPPHTPCVLSPRTPLPPKTPELPPPRETFATPGFNPNKYGNPCASGARTRKAPAPKKPAAGRPRAPVPRNRAPVPAVGVAVAAKAPAAPAKPSLWGGAQMAIASDDLKLYMERKEAEERGDAKSYKDVEIRDKFTARQK
ncbi:hypothetical protein K491DRAFT_254369 [Lophiostoma macrostomum CBS 122681]|uniref:Uncharacterized protein n=1 Tax=Lophiostoma macrostomum CBS 122681 TaxID=1314788 RepID=A0A6A6SK66_9PLEO|nr:hypothetical protein K491DRAFT_254369 [Lophiostoma macrostomum CBS 122681]